MFRLPARLHHALAYPLLTVMAGLVLSLAVARQLDEQIQEQAQGDFLRAAAETRHLVENAFERPLFGLRAAAGLHHVRGALQAAEFRAFVAQQDIVQRVGGVRGLGVLERVRRGELAAFLSRQRAEQGPGFALRSLGGSTGEDLFVVTGVEPLTRNRPALGLDVGSEARRREAVLRAIGSGQPTLSAPVTLVQDGSHPNGFLALLAVYRSGLPVETAAQRQAALSAVVFAPMVVDELLAPVRTQSDRRLELELFHGPYAGERVFQHAPHARGQHPDGIDRWENTALRAEYAIELVGRPFTLRVSAQDGFVTPSDRWLPTGVLGVGLLLTALLAYLTHHHVRARERAEARAGDMTAELARLAMVVRHMSDGVLIMDTEQRVTWANQAFLRISGLVLPDILGRPATTLRPIRSGRYVLPAAAGGGAPQAARGEAACVSPEGRDYVIAYEIQPLLDDQGRLSGYVAIESDISERVRARRELGDAERLNKALLDAVHAHTIVSVTLPDGTIAEVNDAFCALSGYSREALVGQPHSIVRSGLHPPSFWAEMWQTVARGDTWQGQVCNRARDGSLYWVDSIVTPVKGPDGRIERYLSLRTDITRSKRQEMALRVTSERFQIAAQAAGIGVWELDGSNGQLSWDAQTRRLHDLPPSGHAIDLAQWLACIDAADRRGLQHALDRAIFESQRFEQEYRVTTGDGGCKTLRAAGQVVAATREAPLRVIGMCFEVSELRALERELVRRNDLLASIVEHLPCGLSVFDSQLRLVISNSKFRELLDLPDALFQAEQPPRYQDFIHFNRQRGEYSDPELIRLGDRVMASVGSPVEPHRFERVRPNGRTLEVVGGPLPGGGVVTTYTDITDVKRADALLRGAIDAVDEAFVLFDPQDRLVYCNEKYRSVYAISRDLIVPGARFEDIIRGGALRGQYEAAIGRVDEWVAERMAAHRQGNRELIQPLGDGRVLKIIERYLPDGHLVGFRIDITDLVRARNVAEQAAEAKGHFLANMSHEIRTPMNAILGMLALLHKTSLTARQRDYAGKAEGAARSLLGLLNDILDFSKVEAGKMLLDPQAFDTHELVRGLGTILAASAADQAIEVLFEIDPALPRRLIGDVLRLQQVLINLGGNAVKFTSEGEVVIGVGVAERRDDAVRVAFSVTDTGIGIAPEHQQRIFEGFAQAEASTTRRFGGTGLGLAISQRLVRLMGGELALHSAPGQGSRFSFELELPLAEAGSPQALPGPSAVPADLRVLLVQPHPRARQLLACMLDALGWTCTAVDTGEQALARVQAEPARFDVALVDHRGSGLAGVDLCEALRRHATALDLLLLVDAREQDRLMALVDARGCGPVGFLVKPVTASQVHDAVVDARAGRAAPRLRADAAADPAAEAAADAAPVGLRLKGLRLLVAEDNANNQQVVRELLETEGAQVLLVGHGEAAVQAVASKLDLIDAVLMDLQMPVMDGLEATRRIRGAHPDVALPIIAMTANVMASDREACRQAGMDDHVGKPFDLHQLVDVIRRHTGRSGLPLPAARSAETGPSPRALAAAAQAGVELVPALERVGGLLGTYRRLLERFVADLADQPAQLEALAAAGDLPALRRQVHTLKGLAATLGDTTLAARAAHAEAALASLEPDAAQVLAARLARQLREA